MNDPLLHRGELAPLHEEFTASDGLGKAVSGSSLRCPGRG